jgi:rod shape determining protein RodA
LHGVILFRGLRIAANARDRLGMLLATGVVVMLFFHVFVNVGMTIGLMPITGLPLPLLSYGGSFVLASMTALGLLQNVWIHRRVY